MVVVDTPVWALISRYDNSPSLRICATCQRSRNARSSAGVHRSVRKRFISASLDSEAMASSRDMFFDELKTAPFLLIWAVILC